MNNKYFYDGNILRKNMAIFALAISTVFLFGSSVANAHGYISSPKSRVIMCKENNVETPTLPACIAAKAAGNEGLYTPQEVSIGGVKDDHRNYIPDGKLCSVGRANLAGMDLNRTDWPATKVSPGSAQFIWTITAAHKTKYFRYYITRQGHDLTQPLKWDDLELIYDSGPSDRSFDIAHTVVLPARTGKHIVYSIWQRDWETDAAEAFYQCVDVDFGGGSNSSASKSSVNTSSTTSSVVTSSVRSSSSSSLSNNTCNNLPVWIATAIYTQQMSVQYNGKRYTAKWYTQGQNPEQNSGPWDVWVNLGDCISGPISSSSKSSSAVSSASRSSVQSSASSKSSAANSSSSSTAGKCTSPAYVNGASYATGALVQNVGSEYKCLVGGWCTVGGPYAPGVGWAWTNAWSLVQSCQ